MTEMVEVLVWDDKTWFRCAPGHDPDALERMVMDNGLHYETITVPRSMTAEELNNHVHKK